MDLYLEVMRVRTPKNTGTLKNIGKFPSLKNRKIVWFESHLERDFIYLIEFDKNVVQYQEQPFRIKYFLNGKARHYTPDFFIQKRNEKQVIEIKPQLKTEKEEFVQFSRFMTQFFASQGYEYKVITDATIRIQPRLANIKLLWRYARIPITARHQVLIHDLFSDSPKLLLSEVISFLELEKEKKELVYTLLFHGYLLIDIEKPVTMNSLLLIGALE